MMCIKNQKPLGDNIKKGDNVKKGKPKFPGDLLDEKKTDVKKLINKLKNKINKLNLSEVEKKELTSLVEEKLKNQNITELSYNLFANILKGLKNYKNDSLIKIKLEYAINSLLEILNNKNYDESNHYGILINITQNGEENTNQLLNFFKEKINSKKPFSNKDLNDFFNKNEKNNFWLVFKDIKNKRIDYNLEEVVDSLLVLFKNSKYNYEDNCQLISNILKNAKAFTKNALDSFCKILDNPNYDYKIHYPILINISLNSCYKIEYVINSFSKILNNSNYNYKEHNLIINQIILDTKENADCVLNCFLSVLLNKNFSTQEKISFFNKEEENNFWFIYSNILENSKFFTREILSCFSSILKSKNYDKKEHYSLFVNIIKNKKDIELYWTSNMLERILNYKKYDKKIHYPIIFNLVSNTNKHMQNSLETFFKIINDKRYDEKKHYQLLLDISKNKEEIIKKELDSLYISFFYK